MEKNNKKKAEKNNKKEIKEIESKYKKKISDLKEKMKKLEEKNRQEINNINKKNNRKLIILFVLIFLLCIILINSIIKINVNNKNYTKNINNIKEQLATEYLFLGDSITYGYDLQEYLLDYPVINSSIIGNETDDILENLEKRVFKYKPNKLILLIGINDLKNFKEPEHVIKNIEKITEKIGKKYPKCKIYIQSIYPVGKKIEKNYDVPEIDTLKNNIIKTNKEIKQLCKKNNYTYIDIYPLLKTDEDLLDSDYTKDGLHLTEEGYKKITSEIIKYLK